MTVDVVLAPSHAGNAKTACSEAAIPALEFQERIQPADSRTWEQRHFSLVKTTSLAELQT